MRGSRWLGGLGIALVVSASAAESPVDKPAPEPEAAPSIELLEFLGSWETREGRWVDPEELEEMTISESGEQGGNRDR